MRLTLKIMLIGLVGLLLVTMAVQGGIAVVKLAEMNDNVRQVATNSLPSVELINKINTATSDLRIADAAEMLAETPEERQRAQNDVAAALLRIEQDRAKYEPLISSPEEKQVYDTFSSGFDSYINLRGKFQDAISTAPEEAARLFKNEMRSVFDAFSAELEKDGAINDAAAAQQYQDSQAAFDAARLTLAISIVVGLVIAVGGMVFAVLGISRPITRITNSMARISAGQLDTDIPYGNSHNEIGQMSKALTVFRDSLADSERMRIQQAESEQRAEAEKRAAMHELANEFDQDVAGVVRTVAAAVSQLEQSAASMSSSADETSRQSSVVAAAAEQATTNVQVVATAAEELAASVREIGQQVATAAAIAGDASIQASTTATVVSGLSASAQRIGQVVNLIDDIASQTNLLALNATIEAARAGEAGRGFAVVAMEVKTLAEQTSKATGEISSQITAVQGATTEVVKAIEAISDTIRKIDEISTAIASSVEEQGLATGEIAQNVHQAARGTREVSSNITGVNAAATDTGRASGEIVHAAADLTRQAEQLRSRVDTFVNRVRAA